MSILGWIVGVLIVIVILGWIGIRALGRVMSPLDWD